MSIEALKPSNFEDRTPTRLPSPHDSHDSGLGDRKEPSQLQERLSRAFILTVAYVALLIGFFSLVVGIFAGDEAKAATAEAEMANQSALFQYCKNLVTLPDLRKVLKSAYC